ncbi:MAG: arabinogalactan endo-1,4-beta-galactosidase [Chloroflexi bacterium]|nr:arabinogalactan endo-1,4-beta-galactosidase [Chloroflexota bacterium]MBP7042571.1 arabinogalactan endo-1,4-beta-galactosidase [Chloroflexota bacterium]
MNVWGRWIWIIVCCVAGLLIGCREPTPQPLPAAAAVPPSPSPPPPSSIPSPAPPLPTTTPAPPPFWRGVDVSFLPQLEDAGAIFYDQGVPQDALAIVANHGINSVRLRVWVNPPDGHHGKEETLALAKRIHALGLGLLLDVHYSDTWADPAHQTKPAAWADLDFAELETAVYTYTLDLLSALKGQGTLPDIVQIGNEITPGILWDDGRVGGSYNNWPQLAALLQAGIAGVRDSLASTDTIQIMIHLDAGGNNAVCRWFLDNLKAQGVNFDVLGLSYYPWWQGSLADLANNLQDLSQHYPQDIILVETAYPWTLDWQDDTHNLVGEPAQLLPDYPASPAGQAAFLRDVLAMVQAVPGGKGIGVYYWEPEYIAVNGFGSFWENMALFDFAGHSLPALSVQAGAP